MTRESLDAVLRHAVILGTLAVLLIPAARGSNEWLGWLPLVAVALPRRRRVQALRNRRGRASTRLARAA